MKINLFYLVAVIVSLVAGVAFYSMVFVPLVIPTPLPLLSPPPIDPIPTANDVPVAGIVSTSTSSTSTLPAMATTTVVSTTIPAAVVVMASTTPTIIKPPPPPSPPPVPIRAPKPPPVTPPPIAPSPPVQPISVPSVPDGLVASDITDTVITLTWGAANDTAGVAGYRIFINGSASGATSLLKFQATGLNASTNYTFAVSAYNKNGGLSAVSQSISATTLAAQVAPPAPAPAIVSDTIPPSAPFGLSATALSDSEIIITWHASRDNVGVVGYRIYTHGALLATVSGTSFDNQNLIPGTKYTYAIFAYDAANNSSPSSSVSTMTQPVPSPVSTSTAPTPPPASTPPSTPVSGGSISVAFVSPANNATVFGVVPIAVTASSTSPVTKVVLYDGNTLLTTLTVAPYTYSWDISSVKSGVHNLRVVGYTATAAWNNVVTVNVSANAPPPAPPPPPPAPAPTPTPPAAPPASPSVPPPDTTPPTAVITSPTSGTIVAGVIAVTGTATDNVGVTSINLYVDGNLADSVSGGSYDFLLDTGSLTNGNHALSVGVHDAAGNVGTSTAISVNVNN